MKTNRPQLKLLSLLSVIAFAGLQARADDIAQNALAHEKAAQATAPEVRTTPPQRVSDKQTATKPVDTGVAKVQHIDSKPQTGIRTTSSTPIHPVVQDSDVEINPVPRVRPTQADYHMQQLP